MQKRSKIISATLAFLLLFQLFALVTNQPVNATGALKVETYMGNTSQTTNTISPNFKITNNGSATLNMSAVTIRYFFTKDSNSTQNFNCDVSDVTGSFIGMTTPTPIADNYLEISFPATKTLAPNTSMEIKTSISKADGSNYNQSNDYSFSSTNTAYAEWSKVTAYINNIKIWGSEPVCIPNGFLVIASSKLYSSCQSELNTYMSDLTNEGRSPTLIKVNNVSDSNFSGDPSFHVCENPNALKEVIREYYNQGYKGFVIIGSAPAIPNAYWESSPASNENTPTDLYYADMDTWLDTDGDGVYESSYNSQTSAPDMIYGRISSGAISNSDQQESEKTSQYLSKIHAFRLAGRNMTFEPKAFSFADDDFWGYEPQMVAGLGNLEKEIYSTSNMSSTTENKFLELLQGGYRLGFEIIHATQEGWSIPTHPNGTEDGDNFDHPNIDDINGITVKVNYLHLNSCSACDFTTSNLGAAFLFNRNSTTGESNVYNITGMTVSSGFYADPQYFEDLKNNCIGTAFKNVVSRFQNYGSLKPEYILLGDPTLKYNFTNPQNKCPHVSNDLSDVNAYPNKPFKINFQTTDPENDPVSLDVSGLPDGASYDSTTKTIDWMPQASQAGNSYNVTITAYNKDLSGEPVNKYVQNFIIYVSRMNLLPQDIPNPGFESLNTDGKPSDWTRIEDPTIDQIVKRSGNYSAKITTNNPGLYELNKTVEPNTHYLISGYIKTSNVTEGAYLSIYGNNTSTRYSSNLIIGTQDWTPVYLHWYSGNDTSMNIQCRLSNGDTAWFDDIKLEKDYNLGFEFSLNNKASGWSFYSFNSNPDTNSISMSESSTKHSGLRSVSILSNQASNYAFLYKDITVVPNTNYRVSTWVKTRNISGGTTGANLSVRYGSTTVTSPSVLDADTEWRQVYVDFNSGNNSSIRINCKLGDLSGFVTGTAWFDDVTVQEN